MDYVEYGIGMLYGLVYQTGEYFAQSPPWTGWLAAILCLGFGYLLGKAENVSGPDRADIVRRLVADRILDTIMLMTEKGEISWEEAVTEMTRMGRSPRWSEFKLGRLNDYKLSKQEVAQLKGLLRARRKRPASKPVVLPGDKPNDEKVNSMVTPRLAKMLQRRSM